MDKQVHLRDYVRVLGKRRHVILAFLSIVVCFSAISTFSATPMYIATTRLLIEKVEPYTIIDYRYTDNDPQFYATQHVLIKSKLVGERVVKSLLENKDTAALLKAQFVRKPKMTQRFRLWLSGRKLKEGNWHKSAVGRISRGIIVRPLRRTKIVAVSFVSDDPVFSRIVVNKIAEAYIEALFDMRMRASGLTRGWMTKQVEQERAKLRSTEIILQEYMRENDIIVLEGKIAILPQKLSELSSLLTQAETKRNELGALYESLKSLPITLKGAESIPAVARDSIINSLRKQFIASDQRVFELSKKYGLKHPVMIQAQNENKVIRDKILQELERLVRSVNTDYQLAEQNVSNLRGQLSQTKHEAQETKEKFIQYGVLQRDVHSNSLLFDSLLKRMGEQSINEEIHSVKVVQYEQAERPRRPFKPNKSMDLMLAFIIGSIGGIGLAFLVDYFDNTIKSPDEFEDRFNVPVIGLVRRFGSKIGRRRKDNDKDTVSIETAVQDDPKSTFSESFKALRTAIMLSSADSPPRSILVTSMGPSEGKTSTSTNLALAVKLLQKKVLLIDCDLRKPRIHKIFGMDNSKGISTYLAGDESDIVKEGPQGLSIITSGPIPPDPSELLGSRRFDQLVRKMSEQYDFIVCDSPPSLSVADALVLGSKVDGTIVVARAGKTTYDMLDKGFKALQDVKTNILGLLINAVEFNKGDYYYYKYYNYYEAYGYSEDEIKAEADSKKPDDRPDEPSA